MLPSDQIEGLQDYAAQLTASATEYIIKDIVQRIVKAGKITSRVEYLTYRAQTLGVDWKTIEKQLSVHLDMSKESIRKLYKVSARMFYSEETTRFSDYHVSYEQNGSVQQITMAAAALADDDFSNITQTIGMVSPKGEDLPLKDFYRSTMDWVFNNVSFGVMDYNTAIQHACTVLADKGLTSVNYKSGVITSLEAAVRRNIMGGLGLMVEQISAHNYDVLGADGWEISAHANSAEDHEPIQGKQYSNEDYQRLNNSLKRRIGTLNCGHYASPIKIGIHKPVFTDEQLQQFKDDNAKGVVVDGKHYTGYQATQKQRKIEREIRKLKKQSLAAENSGDSELATEIKANLTKARRAYSEYSEKAGLKTQQDRLYIVGLKKAA